MDTYSVNPAVFLIITIVSFIQFFFVLRFLCEIMRVSYNNQITQLIIKFTNPILVPLRIIPLYFGRVDLIIIIVIVLITALKNSIALLLFLIAFIIFDIPFSATFIEARKHVISSIDFIERAFSSKL